MRLRHLATSVMVLAATTMLGLGMTTAQALGGLGDGNADIMTSADKTPVRTMLAATASPLPSDDKCATDQAKAEPAPIATTLKRTMLAGSTTADPSWTVAMTSNVNIQDAVMGTFTT